MEFGADSDGGGGLSLISAGFAHGRSRGRSEWVDGEAAQLGVRRIEAGWRAVADATNGGDSARFCPLELNLAPRKEKGGLGRNGKLRGHPRECKQRSDVEDRRDCRRVAPLAGDQRRYGRRGTVSSTGGALFARLKDFSPSLTS